MVCYAIALWYYILKAFENTTSVFIILSLFCAIRVITYLMFAIIKISRDPALEIYVAAWVLYEIGIFALLYSAHALVLDREVMNENGNVTKNPVSRITSSRLFICFVLGVAVIFGIAAWVCEFQENPSGFPLQETCVSIFLFATVLLAGNTIFHFGRGRSAWSLYLIAIFLLIRGIYRVVSINRDQSSAVWYPLAVVSELLAVFLFAVTGLVP